MNPTTKEEVTELVERVFGPGFGTDAEAGARASKRVYVRSIDQLVEFRDGAKGRRLTALEALRAYGIGALAEVAAEGSALLAPSGATVGRTLRARRAQLALEVRHVASVADLPVEVVEAAEQSRKLPIRQYERVARALGLDERYISVREEPEGNERVAVRLRVIGDTRPALRGGTVAALADAAWVAMTQVRLEDELGLRAAPTGITHSLNYGTPDFPAYAWGYRLAADARQKLDLENRPIPSVRALAEERLNLPIIQAELGERIAGVTLEVGNRRAIVVNLSGKNRHVYVRRSTVAHELGHLLYDSPRYLNDLRVDEYADLERRAEELRDPVEQRANAFAVEFLAPQVAAVEHYHQSQGDRLGEVMDLFGLSFTAARYQIWNGVDRRIPLDSLVSDRVAATPAFEAAETFTIDYHPIRGIAPARAGRFSAVVVRAAEEGSISWDTAAEWLEVPEQNVKRGAAGVRSLYPAVFINTP
jgi:Zn-dependent peptidase ImmA (M78 family)